ncbi:MAG: DNA polymerase III subunit gamma/tau [Mariprofundaceae bacterium]|nr:DNA polymerase III subunit gamma/tau [Mariprofundaceae bacterium]
MNNSGYKVLARRCRPQRFADLTGQDVVVRTLQNALKNKQMAHAYLLTGIRGTGKTTIARLLAAVVNCDHPEHGEPCGVCDACASISHGNNLDVQEMDAASHTKVEEMREILDGVRYPPTRLPFKVYIIDEAHMLSRSAFNALLKTLEEPPERVLFILATTEVEKLPVTVRSRCQRFDLRRLGADEISRYLAHVLTEEKIAYEPESLHEIAHAADGSVRDALSLTERVLAYAGEQLTMVDVRKALGLVGPEIIRQLSDAIFTGQGKTALDTLRQAVSSGHAPRAILMALGEIWHELACLMVDETLLESEPGEAQQQWLAGWTDCWDAQGLDLRYQVLLHGLRDLGLVDERRGAEMLVLRLAGLYTLNAPRKTPAIESNTAGQPETGDVVDNGSDDGGSSVALHQDKLMEERAGSASQSSSAAVDSHDEGGGSEADLLVNPQDETPGRHCVSWEEAVAAYGQVRAGMAAMLEHVLCLDFAEKVRLALDKHQERAIATAERMAFSEWLGREVHWEPRSEHEGETLSQVRIREAEANQQQLEKAAREDTHVQALMREFGAKIEHVRAPGTAADSEI